MIYYIVVHHKKIVVVQEPSPSPAPPTPPLPKIEYIKQEIYQDDSKKPSWNYPSWNYPTRGFPTEIQQIGILNNKHNSKILPLYGRKTYPSSSKWNYYTNTDKYSSVQLPVEYKHKDCTSEYGCEEVYDEDSVYVKGYDDQFRVILYKMDSPRYIPVV
jgi:hypothetical protein